MEEEARVRLAEESHLKHAAQQDQESIRLMKQALLLEKILANFDEGNVSQRVNQINPQSAEMNERESESQLGESPSKQVELS